MKKHGRPGEGIIKLFAGTELPVGETRPETKTKEKGWPRPVSVTKVSNGYVAEIGCKVLVTGEDGLDKLRQYFDGEVPKEFEKYKDFAHRYPVIEVVEDISPVGDPAECVKGEESVDTRWRQIDMLHKSGRAAVFEVYEASNGYVINNHRERKGYVVENGTHLGGVLECICSDMKGTVATMHKFEKEK